MKYMGSKNKFSKYIIPIIESYFSKDTNGYLEPFVGGANIIDKISHHNKIGCDIHKYLIALLNYIKSDKELPITITSQEYKSVRDNKEKYEDWYVGFVGFCGSYNGKWFGGYAGECNTKEGVRHYDKEAIRNIESQRKNLKNIKLYNKSFQDIKTDKLNGYVIYCDPPYKDTTSYKTQEFPYDEFYEWCIDASDNNVVLISEYWMPEDKFESVWSKECKTTLDKNSRGNRIEKLFKVKSK